jgi:hypothetical protein
VKTAGRPSHHVLFLLAKVGDILLSHIDGDTLELDATGYYQDLIRTFSQSDFRQELPIPSVLPDTTFYGLHAHLDADEHLHFKVISEPFAPTDFWVIV